MPIRTWIDVEASPARQPLRSIIEDCAAFEDAIAGAGASATAPGNTSPDVGEPAVHATVAAVEAARAAMPDERTQETIVLLSKTAATVGPVMEAVGRLGPAARVGALTAARYQPSDGHGLRAYRR